MASFDSKTFTKHGRLMSLEGLGISYRNLLSGMNWLQSRNSHLVAVDSCASAEKVADGSRGHFQSYHWRFGFLMSSSWLTRSAV
jgi:hypothetical protein